MDLVGAECRRGGTRGRGAFSWDSVKKQDREYYLGNSVAGVKSVWDQPTSAYDRTNQEEIQAVRRREKALFDAALGGRSFADAVRSALTASADSDVDDERIQGNENVVDSQRAATSKQERSEKAQRKLLRRQRREIRRRRRAERNRRRSERRDEASAQNNSSESDRENSRSRVLNDSEKPRRRRERESAAKRKRSDRNSSSDMYDSDININHRRTRLR